MELIVPEYKIDYNKPIVGFGNFTTIQNPNKVPMIDPGVVRRKFEIWNTIGNMGILSETFAKMAKPSERKIQQLRAINLLNTDKTIFAYHNFKIDNKPCKLRWYQDIMINDKHDRILFASSNQIGKSITLDVDAAIEFSRDHGKEWVGILVSKSLEQSKYQMSRIKQLLKSAKTSYKEESTTDTKTSKRDSVVAITYTFYDYDGVTPLYTNTLVCCPPTGSALGYPVDRMWLDEFDFWENIDQNWFMQQVAIPRTIETEGSIIVFSNPNGKDRELYALWEEKYKDGTPIWHRYNFNYWDKPGANQEQFDKLTARMTRNQIESTMLAVFASSAGAFLSYEEIQDQIDKELSQKGDSAGYGRETAWFLDIGSKHDQSALIGAFVEPNPDPELKDTVPIIKAFYIHKYPQGYPIARVVGVMNEVDATDGWELEGADNPSIKEVLDQYSEKDFDKEGNLIRAYLPLFGCDVTGNSGIIPLFQSIGVDPVDITFSGKKKWYMYQRYQYYSEMRFFKRAYDRDDNTIMGSDFTYQASRLVVKKSTNTTYRQIHHEREDDLDDTQDACFIGSTKILTYSGQKPIKDVTCSDYVMTRQGWKRVKAKIEHQAKVITKYGITATPNHPFIVKGKFGDKIEKFKYINESCVLYKWNEKQKYIMEGNITDIQTQNVSTLDLISGHIEVIDPQKPCTVIYGRKRLEKFQKDTSFIIKMKTHLITQLKIWNVFRNQFMQVITILLNQRKNLEKIGKSMAMKKPKNGMGLKKEKVGIRNIMKKLLEIFQLERLNVKSVLMKFKQEMLKKSIVQENVFTKPIISEERTVYNLEIEDCHEFFANNILVHNCVGVIHLIENPDLPSLSFDLISFEGESIINDEEDENKKQLKKNNPELEGQYIPSYYNNDEMENWMNNQDKHY